MAARSSSGQFKPTCASISGRELRDLDNSGRELNDAGGLTDHGEGLRAAPVRVKERNKFLAFEQNLAHFLQSLGLLCELRRLESDAIFEVVQICAHTRGCVSSNKDFGQGIREYQ
jgi:hypothetical protein